MGAQKYSLLAGRNVLHSTFVTPMPGRENEAPFAGPQGQGR
jgi:hypothetical protein